MFLGSNESPVSLAVVKPTRAVRPKTPFPYLVHLEIKSLSSINTNTKFFLHPLTLQTLILPDMHWVPNFSLRFPRLMVLRVDQLLLDHALFTAFLASLPNLRLIEISLSCILERAKSQSREFTHFYLTEIHLNTYEVDVWRGVFLPNVHPVELRCAIVVLEPNAPDLVDFLKRCPSLANLKVVFEEPILTCADGEGATPRSRKKCHPGSFEWLELLIQVAQWKRTRSFDRYSFSELRKFQVIMENYHKVDTPNEEVRQFFRTVRDGLISVGVEVILFWGESRYDLS
ncbi:hypothetical protein D9757_000437 [Collybiopsis confluens]|uniref:FBD domain-containing protein n=1 Tax=Collybiopsis confluens TaxID=2823264 RepID=A0A8H5MGS0_9AGAR|nr:hypothetical protein D9757_000437 [Collybiopsis confluens]